MDPQNNIREKNKGEIMAILRDLAGSFSILHIKEIVETERLMRFELHGIREISFLLCGMQMAGQKNEQVFKI